MRSQFNLSPSVGRVKDYKTYAFRQPIATHTRRATCQEVNCEHFHNGFSLPLAGVDAAMLRIIKTSGKKFREAQLVKGGDTFLVFEPGQQCFSQHRISIDREPFYFIGGNHYSAFTPRRENIVPRATEWQERMDENLHNIKEIRERG